MDSVIDISVTEKPHDQEDHLTLAAIQVIE
jgi:hypothetical protein